jgi:hypothetical protein
MRTVPDPLGDGGGFLFDASAFEADALGAALALALGGDDDAMGALTRSDDGEHAATMTPPIAPQVAAFIRPAYLVAARAAIHQSTRDP